MKTLTTIFAAIFLVTATGAYAQKPPDKVTLKAEKSKDGPVTLDHKAHGKVKDGCKACHGAGKPQKITLGEEKAHKVCHECHVKMAKGPADVKKCDGCHKKERCAISGE